VATEEDRELDLAASLGAERETHAARRIERHWGIVVFPNQRVRRV